MKNKEIDDTEDKPKAPKVVRRHRSSGKQTRTAPTKKANRFANLQAHAERHPRDSQSAKHLANDKWANYR